ncbi:hypothetical protein HHUSO_G2482 [Huso huso]|uniref:Uncharacterized protein n=1 Tax=Huso huso TaxID=61971 RepID=A0ABR1A7G0_HUSHU
MTPPQPCSTTEMRPPSCSASTLDLSGTSVERHIIKMLININDKLDHNTRMLNTIINQNTRADVDDLPEDIELPLVDIPSLDSLERRLKDLTFQKQLAL